jgi:hypothetical protein
VNKKMEKERKDKERKEESGTGGKRRCCDAPAYVNGIPGPHSKSCEKNEQTD